AQGRLAAPTATPPAIETLAAIHARLEAAEGDHDLFVRTDMAFHGQIAEMSGNAIVAAAVRGMLGWIIRFRTEMVSVEGAESLTITEHARILKAIAAGDPAEAAAAMADHLGRANALYAQLVAAGPAPA
ncbi:FCD domain-containing protein, partial [Nostoc sp. NIES-2111]